MAFDYKKEYKEYYMPSSKPEIVNIPKMNYIAIKGTGNPNEEDGEYKKAMAILYGIAFTIKMSYKTDHKIDGYFEYVVPPLEGFWWQDGIDGIDYSSKETYKWISLIRLPEFVTINDFNWAKETIEKKKKIDCSKAYFLEYEEGLSVQIMHIGPFDDEPRSVKLMNEYLESHGYITDINDNRFHHEIYMSDARKTDPAKLKTVIRHPIRKIKCAVDAMLNI